MQSLCFKAVMQTLSHSDKVCGVIKPLYSCTSLPIFSSVVSVSVSESYWPEHFAVTWNVTFSIFGGEPLKFCCWFVVGSFNLFHEFSLVVGIEKSLLSLASRVCGTCVNFLVWIVMGHWEKALLWEGGQSLEQDFHGSGQGTKPVWIQGASWWYLPIWFSFRQPCEECAFCLDDLYGSLPTCDILWSRRKQRGHRSAQTLQNWSGLQF